MNKCDAKCSTKCCVISVIVVFIFFFLFDFLVHGNLMMGMYQATADVWRPESEMKHAFGMISNLLVAIFSVGLICCATNGNCGSECVDGSCKCNQCPIKIGVMLGLFVASMQLGSYAWMPVPFSIVGGWMAASFVKFAGVGVILKLLYGKKCNKASSAE